MTLLLDYMTVNKLSVENRNRNSWLRDYCGAANPAHFLMEFSSHGFLTDFLFPCMTVITFLSFLHTKDPTSRACVCVCVSVYGGRGAGNRTEVKTNKQNHYKLTDNVVTLDRIMS